MGSFRIHAAAPVAAMVGLPLSVAQTIVAAVEYRPDRPVGDHFTNAEDGSPRPAIVTAAAAGMLEGVHLSITEGCSPRPALVTAVATDVLEGLAGPALSVATDRLLRSMGSVGWPSPLR